MESLGATLNSTRRPRRRHPVGLGAGRQSRGGGPGPRRHRPQRDLPDRGARAPAQARDRFGLSVQMKDPGALAAWWLCPCSTAARLTRSLANGTPGSLASLSQADLARPLPAMVAPGQCGPDRLGRDRLGRRPTRWPAALFGDWRGEGPAPSAPAARAGTAQPVRTIVIDLPGAGQAAVLAAVRAVDRSDPDYYNLSARQCGARRSARTGGCSRRFGPSAP